MGIVRSVRSYLLEQGWTVRTGRVSDGEEIWVCDVGAARSFPGGPLPLAAQVQLELDRVRCETGFSEQVQGRLVELGWGTTPHGFLVDHPGDGRAHPLIMALDVQLRREVWHERRTGAELLTPPPVNRSVESDRSRA
jgi:hypothetical protein